MLCVVRAARLIPSLQIRLGFHMPCSFLSIWLKATSICCSASRLLKSVRWERQRSYSHWVPASFAASFQVCLGFHGFLLSSFRILVNSLTVYPRQNQPSNSFWFSSAFSFRN